MTFEIDFESFLYIKKFSLFIVFSYFYISVEIQKAGIQNAKIRREDAEGFALASQSSSLSGTRHPWTDRQNH